MDRATLDDQWMMDGTHSVSLVADERTVPAAGAMETQSIGNLENVLESVSSLSLRSLNSP